MADEGSMQVSSGSLPQSEDARFATAEDKAARKKRYYAERDAAYQKLFHSDHPTTDCTE